MLWVIYQVPDNVATSFTCCCTTCAEPQQWKFEQQFFIIELLRGLLTCQDVTCLGGNLANSAHQLDRDQLFQDAHWQCRTNVIVPLGRLAGIELGSLSQRSKSVVHAGLDFFLEGYTRSGTEDGHV